MREICDSVNLKRTAVHQIIKEDLNLSKVSVRWVSRPLSTEEKEARVTASEKFLRRYEREAETVSLVVSLLPMKPTFPYTIRKRNWSQWFGNSRHLHHRLRQKDVDLLKNTCSSSLWTPKGCYCSMRFRME